MGPAQPATGFPRICPYFNASGPDYECGESRGGLPKRAPPLPYSPLTRRGKDRPRPLPTPMAATTIALSLLPVVFVLFLTITAVGSSRNYGIRYLLPLAPLAIVWVSALAESRRRVWPRVAAAVGLAGLVAAVAGSHPYELTYFNILAGGPEGGRHILADSNLDWGQGLEIAGPPAARAA